jgi:hypothetical protein
MAIIADWSFHPPAQRRVTVTATQALVVFKDEFRTGLILTNEDDADIIFWTTSEGNPGSAILPGMSITSDKGEIVDVTEAIYASTPAGTTATLSIAEYKSPRP